MRKLKKDRIIGVDFDGTLATIDKPYPAIGEPIQEIIDYILKEQSKGAHLVLVTMREGMALEGALMWCEDHGIKFDAVNDNLDYMKDWFKNNPRKIFCNEYIDDNNFGGIDYILKEIRKRKGE
jgi:hypothetical protein